MRCFVLVFGVLSIITGHSQIVVGGGEERGEAILRGIVSQNWAKDWKDSKLNAVKLVSQKKDLAHPTGLPPVWVAEIEGPGGSKGTMMWDQGGEGRIVEFTLDAKFEIKNVISGIPNLQQFPIEEEDGKVIASGCVPTAAASVVSFWVDKKFPQWRGEDGETPADITRRLRARLKMVAFSDTDGFTGNGMALAGAFPHDLAKAIQADAQEKSVGVECRIARFSIELLKEEIKAGRPVLLSCTVRVPHKPHLSWGHEMAGVGWTRIDGVNLVGVMDNFHPTKHAETIRWIREDVFRSLISIRPRKRD
jgi:hypothetical protein